MPSVARVARTPVCRRSRAPSATRTRIIARAAAKGFARAIPLPAKRPLERSHGKKMVCSRGLFRELISTTREGGHLDQGHEDRHRDEGDAGAHAHDDERL